MNNLTLRQLRYVEALARLRHFGRAAEDCAISQPALSMQVRAVEEEIGVVLFERGAREVRLTPFGMEFAERSREILRAVEELGDLARAATGALTGRLRLGIIPTVAPYLLPAVISRLSAGYPQLDLQVRETITPTLLRELSDGRIDAAVVALPVSEPSLQEVELFSENFVLVRAVRDSSTPVPDRAGLQEMRLLLLEEGHCFRDQALSFCHAGGPAPREMLEGSSLSTLVQMVGAGIGVTLIPEMAVSVEARSAPVSIARFPAPRPGRRIGMIWRRTSPLSSALGRVAEIVKEEGETLLNGAEHRA